MSVREIGPGDIDPRDVPPDNPGKDWFLTSPRFLNLRVQGILEGDGGLPAKESSDIIVHLLRSGFHLDDDTREMLADALERGRDNQRCINPDGNDVPFLQLASFGQNRGLIIAETKRRGYLDAADLCRSLQAQGKTRSEAMAKAGKSIGLRSARQMEDVLAFAEGLPIAIKARDPLLFERAREMVCEDECFELEDDEDFMGALREAFVEIEAEKAMHIDPTTWQERRADGQAAYQELATGISPSELLQTANDNRGK